MCCMVQIKSNWLFLHVAGNIPELPLIECLNGMMTGSMWRNDICAETPDAIQSEEDLGLQQMMEH